MESFVDYELYLGRGYKIEYREGHTPFHILIYKDNHIIARFEKSDCKTTPVRGLFESRVFKDLEELEELYTNIYTLLEYLCTEYENKTMYQYGRLRQ